MVTLTAFQDTLMVTKTAGTPLTVGVWGLKPAATISALSLPARARAIADLIPAARTPAALLEHARLPVLISKSLHV
jgi:hypothetical protein